MNLQKLLFIGAFALLTLISARAQVSLVDDLRPGGASALASDIQNSTAIVNEILYFPATVNNGFRELYRSDGTADGTYPVYDKDGNPVNTPNKMVSLNELIIFRAVSGSVGALWRSDGTDAGTYPITTLNLGDILCMTTVGDKVYFNAASTMGTTLWVSDGTAEGTSALFDDSGEDLTFACEFTGHDDGKVYFIGAQAGSGQELWVTDGTSGGTRIVKDVVPGSASGLSGWIASHGGNLYFNATTTDHGNELWVSDGTENGTKLLKDIWEGTVGSTPSPSHNGEQFFFNADDGPNGRELWTTDGTEGGTQIWYQSRPGIAGNSSIPFFDTMGTGYIGQFSSVDYGNELFTVSTDGVFTLVEEIVPGLAGIFVRDWTRVGRKAFFVTDDQSSGIEVWETDGDAPGTFIHDVQMGPSSSEPELLKAGNNGFFFAARRSDVGKELFYYDASIAGLIELSDDDYLDIYPNPVATRLHFESSLSFESAIILNQSGQILGKASGQELTSGIDVSGLTNGIYIVTLLTKSGDSISQKFVKMD